MMNRTAILLLAALALTAGHATIWACNSGTVRDAAFQGRRDVHRLCLIANRDDPQADALYARLETWFQSHSEGLNLEIERLNADDPEMNWTLYGIPSAPPEVPVVVLVGTSAFLRQAFVVDHWLPGPADEDLAQIGTSPALEAAKKHLVEVWAVILYSPGAEASGSGQAEVDNLAARWEAEHAPGVEVVRLDRKDPRERLLCAFLGIPPSGPDWAGVMFGRGRIMGPPVQGEDLTVNNLEQLLAQLIVPCTCMQDALFLGVDVPLTWERSLDDKFASLEAAASGYTEITFSEQAAALADTVPDEPRRLLAGALAPLGGMALAALAAVGLLVWRYRRHHSTGEIG